MPQLTRLVISFIFVGLIGAGSAFAQAFDTKATAAYVLDQTTGTVLMSKNASTC